MSIKTHVVITILIELKLLRQGGVISAFLSNIKDIKMGTIANNIIFVSQCILTYPPCLYFWLCIFDIYNLPTCQRHGKLSLLSFPRSFQSFMKEYIQVHIFTLTIIYTL